MKQRLSTNEEEPGDGRRETGDGRRATGDGRRETGDGRRETGDGRRETGDGRREDGYDGACVLGRCFSSIVPVAARPDTELVMTVLGRNKCIVMSEQGLLAESADKYLQLDTCHRDMLGLRPHY